MKEHPDVETVAVVGCGVLGSKLASNLVELSIRQFGRPQKLILVDPDEHESGIPKVIWLRDTIRKRFHQLNIKTYQERFETACHKFREKPDYIVAAVDNWPAIKEVFEYMLSMKCQPMVADFVNFFRHPKTDDLYLTTYSVCRCFPKRRLRKHMQILEEKWKQGEELDGRDHTSDVCTNDDAEKVADYATLYLLKAVLSGISRHNPPMCIRCN